MTYNGTPGAAERMLDSGKNHHHVDNQQQQQHSLKRSYHVVPPKDTCQTEEEPCKKKRHIVLNVAIDPTPSTMLQRKSPIYDYDDSLFTF